MHKKLLRNWSMKNDNENNALSDPKLNDEIFLKQLGAFLKRMRIASGFPTIRAFVDTIDMSYSQYQGYEKGKNITVVILKRIFSEFNLQVEDWLKIDIFNIDTNDPEVIEKIRTARLNQVTEQVRIIDSEKAALLLRPVDVQRYVDILIHCHIPKSRSYILDKLVRLDDTHNTFQRVAGKLIMYGWLDYTNKESKNSPAQAYYTTEAGKKALQLTNSK